MSGKIRFVNIPRTIKTKLQAPSVLMANVRSVFNKVDEVRLRADKHKTSLIVLTESWLNADTPDSAIAIKGYDIIRKDRGSHGGGILCYIQSGLLFTAFDDLSPASQAPCDSEVLSVFIETLFLVLIVIYHPFWDNRSAADNAISCLSSMLDILKHGGTVPLRRLSLKM